MKTLLVAATAALTILLLIPSHSAASPDATAAADATATAPTADKSAETAPSDKESTIEEAVATGKSVFGSFKGGKWREAIAGCITLLLFLWRRFLSRLVIGKLSSWWVGFVTVLVGYAASVPEALSSGDFHWTTFVWSGLLTSAEAMLLWQMIGKKALPKIFGDHKPAEEKPA